MKLLLLYPALAARECSECRKWVYDKNSAIPKRLHNGEKIKLRGKPPCSTCPKCTGDEKSPEAGIRAELSRKNQMMLAAYWSTKGTGVFQGDQITRECFGIIEQVIHETQVSLQKSSIESGGAIF